MSETVCTIEIEERVEGDWVLAEAHVAKDRTTAVLFVIENKIPGKMGTVNVTGDVTSVESDDLRAIIIEEDLIVFDGGPTKDPSPSTETGRPLGEAEAEAEAEIDRRRERYFGRHGHF